MRSGPGLFFFGVFAPAHFKNQTTLQSHVSSVHSSSSVQGEMLVRWLIAAIYSGSILTAATPAWAQACAVACEPRRNFQRTAEVPILDEVRFMGLRRIAPAAVAAQLKSREGEPFDAGRSVSNSPASSSVRKPETHSSYLSSGGAAVSFQGGVFRLPAALTKADQKNAERQKNSEIG